MYICTFLKKGKKNAPSVRALLKKICSNQSGNKFNLKKNNDIKNV